MAKHSTTSILSSIGLFSALSKKELAAIQQLMSPVNVPAGREFIKEGAVGREAFIIVSGDATVWRHGKLITTVGPGSVIGEMAVLAGTPRTATVKAETDMVVEVLTKGEFSQLLDSSPGLARKLLVAAIGRLQELEPSLLG